MNAQRSRVLTSAALGAALVAAGLLVNRWALGDLLPRVSRGLTVARSIGLFALDFAVVLAGLRILHKRAALPGPRAAHLLAAAGLFAAALVAGRRLALQVGLVDPDRQVRGAVSDMLASEKVLLDITPSFKRTLSRAAMNLALPDAEARKLFADTVTVVDLADAEPTPRDRLPTGGISTAAFALAAPRTVPLAELGLWRPLFDRVAHFEHAKLYPIRGAFVSDDRIEFDVDLGFDALARTPSGALRAARGKLAARLRGRLTSATTTEWRIHALRTVSLELMDAPASLFEERTERALAADPASLARARGSAHEADVVACLPDMNKPGCERFTVPAIDRHPGVTVVDVDRDGLDDLYVMDEHGKNLLLRNRGDGTFTDVAPALGLDLDGDCASAIFADLDNDGDLDVFIGRTLQRSVILMNEGGRFVDRSASLAAEPLPFLVSSVSAADYDGDGLLDLYVSTYASALTERRRLDLGARAPGLLADYLERPGEAVAAHPEGLLGELLPPAEARELFRRVMTDPHQGIENLHGPPNVLLHNDGGGRFSRDTRSPALLLYRNTFQSTWADVDGDGDPDLFCANDFGPGSLFRNEGGGRFTDVSASTGAGSAAFGMGASFGDYDNDGRLDLYVSAMFSKAGSRITAQIPGLDPVFARMASGNALLHNLGDRFEHVSGLAPPALLVQKADWSYSSQLVDLDGDGFLDVYAPCGYYTAPPSVAVEVDL
jgi:hypothetical protein